MPGRKARLRRSRLGGGVVACSLLLVLGSSCALREYRFETHRERAARYVELGQIDVALIELRSALSIRPNHPDVNFRIAELETQQHHFAEAKFYYGEANRHDPDDVEAAVKYARLILAERPKKARRLVEGAVELEPENPWGHIGRSEIALVGGDTEAALEAARRAYALAPEEPAAIWQMARVRVAQIRALVLDGEQPSRVLVGAAALAISSYVASGADDSVRAVLELGRVLAMVPGQEKAAGRWLGQVLDAASKLEGEEELRLFAIQESLAFARKTGDRPFELGASRAWVELDPADLEAWQQLARASAKGPARRAVFEELIAQRPDDAQAHVMVVREQVDELGLDWATSFLRERADAGVDPPLLLGLLAELQLSAGREDEWEATSRALVADYPLHPLGRLARAHLALARPEPGTTPEEEAQIAGPILRNLVLQSESPLTQHLLAHAESRLGDNDAALRAIERAIELGSAGPEVDRLHARILHDLGRWHEARVALLRVKASSKLTKDERLMLARCAYRTDGETFGRYLLIALLDEQDPPVAAAIELAEQEAPEGELRETIIGVLDANLLQGSRDSRVVEVATKLDLMSGQRARAIDRLLRQIDLEIAIGTRAQQQGRQLSAQLDFDAADRETERAADARQRLTLLTRDVAALNLRVEELREILGGLRVARRSGLINPQGQAWIGKLQFAAGYPKRARNSFEQALAAGVKDAWVKSELAALLASHGVDLGRATQLARQVVDADPQDAEAVATLGYVYLRSGEYERALEQFRNALALSEAAGQPRADFQYHVGLALAALGKREEAVEALDQALAIDPTLQAAADAIAELELPARAENTHNNPS